MTLEGVIARQENDLLENGTAAVSFVRPIPQIAVDLPLPGRTPHNAALRADAPPIGGRPRLPFH